MIEKEIKATQDLTAEAAESLGKLHEQLNDYKEPNQVLVALTILNKPVYRGSVPEAVKADRRRKNKAARKARRATRK